MTVFRDDSGFKYEQLDGTAIAEFEASGNAQVEGEFTAGDLRSTDGKVYVAIPPSTSTPLIKAVSQDIHFRNGADTAFVATTAGLVISSGDIRAQSKFFWTARGELYSPDATTIQARSSGNNDTCQLEVNVAKMSGGFAVFGASVPATQPAHIADPTGGSTQDTEARAAIAAINARLELYGLSATS